MRLLQVSMMGHPIHSARRASAFVSLGLVLAAAAPAAAQERSDVTTRVVTRQGEPGEVTMRRLKARVDSLARAFSETENVAEQRRIGLEIDRTVSAMDRLGMRMAESMARASTVSLAASEPRGWIGYVLNGVVLEPWVERGELMLRYVTHPEVVSVEPSSPAERAGLLAGDTLISYDGQDVRESVSLTRLLRPNTRVMVKVKRDGRFRELPVMIAELPSRIQLRRDDMRSVSIARVTTGFPGAEGFPAPTPPPAPDAPPPVGSARVYMRMPRPAVAPRAPVAAPGVIATTAPGATPAAATATGIAGAYVMSVTEGLGRTIGVPHGVFVGSAPIGSPANASGLMDGDVIVRADGVAVSTVPELRALVGAVVDRGERSMELEIVRERKVRKVVLRW